MTIKEKLSALRASVCGFVSDVLAGSIDDEPDDPAEHWQTWHDDLALEVARKIAALGPQLPGGKVQHVAQIQTILKDALGKANPPPLVNRDQILAGIRWPDLVPNDEDPNPALATLASQFIAQSDAVDWDLAAGRDPKDALDRRAVARVALALAVMRHRRGRPPLPVNVSSKPAAYIGRAMLGYLNRSADGYIDAALYTKRTAYMLDDPIAIYTAPPEAVEAKRQADEAERYEKPTVESFIPTNRETQDQIAAVILATGSPEEKAEALQHLGAIAPKAIHPATPGPAAPDFNAHD